ncbi:uncharacterized protein LOC120351009 [Nilaparvata lugens]|uniref:uncharacterized protein LOC120351009 n=1 Tax=Nilaparvata lugens TaxID=108931 RepID=UPI00193D948A|nr:uncharacterized protein LOC120351009 [Nilaparvata lugens]
MTRAKGEICGKMSEDLKIDIILIQETHVAANMDKKLKIPGYTLVNSLNHDKHGIATFVTSNIASNCSGLNGNSHAIGIAYGGLSIFNVYKPPGEEWENPVLPHAAHPCIYAGDFNSHSPLWGYRTENRDGESLIRWDEVNDCHLEYDAKQGSTFHSARWGTSTTPDLCFVSCNREGRPLHVTRSVESRFPGSKHSMVVLEIGMRLLCVQNPELPRWNLRKAVWAKFTEEVEKTVSRIPINIPNYERFSRLLFMAAKRSIPRGHRKNYVPCWNAECA